MEELTKTLMKLMEEKGKLIAALEFLKNDYENMEESIYKDHLKLVLGFTGLLQKEVDVIQFDKKEVAE